MMKCMQSPLASLLCHTELFDRELAMETAAPVTSMRCWRAGTDDLGQTNARNTDDNVQVARHIPT